MSEQPRTCVVICHWVGHKPRRLHQLLDQMGKVDAGAPFDLAIVVNGGDRRPLTLPPRFDPLRPKILNRENHGYNLGAWDHGWRTATDHDYYLFLQDECFLKRPNWIADFEFRMDHDPGVGLLGEFLMWQQQTWDFVRASTDRDLGRSAWPEDEPTHPIDTYKALLRERGLPLTAIGEHLSTIILFTSRKILEEVDGFPILGDSYRQGVAVEIGFSRLLAERGYRLALIRDRPFTVIGHRQWTRAREIEDKWRGRARAILKRIGLKR